MNGHVSHQLSGSVVCARIEKQTEREKKSSRTHRIQLVDRDDELLHPKTPHQHSMLARLPAPFEPFLKAAARSIDDEDRRVGLRRARDHVRDKVAVAGGVDEGEAAMRRRERVDCDVDRDTPVISRGAELAESTASAPAKEAA